MADQQIVVGRPRLDPNASFGFLHMGGWIDSYVQQCRGEVANICLTEVVVEGDERKGIDMEHVACCLQHRVHLIAHWFPNVKVMMIRVACCLLVGRSPPGSIRDFFPQFLGELHIRLCCDGAWDCDHHHNVRHGYELIAFYMLCINCAKHLKVLVIQFRELCARENDTEAHGVKYDDDGQVIPYAERNHYSSPLSPLSRNDVIERLTIESDRDVPNEHHKYHIRVLRSMKKLTYLDTTLFRDGRARDLIGLVQGDDHDPNFINDTLTDLQMKMTNIGRAMAEEMSDAMPRLRRLECAQLKGGVDIRSLRSLAVCCLDDTCTDESINNVASRFGIQRTIDRSRLTHLSLTACDFSSHQLTAIGFGLSSLTALQLRDCRQLPDLRFIEDSCLNERLLKFEIKLARNVNGNKQTALKSFFRSFMPVLEKLAISGANKDDLDDEFNDWIDEQREFNGIDVDSVLTDGSKLRVNGRFPRLREYLLSRE